MEKFKKGDKFIPRKPKVNNTGLLWCEGMDKFSGKTLTIKKIDKDGDILSEETDYYFHPSWCEKIGNSEIPNDHVPDVGKTIDWEQRRYELAKSAMQGILSNPVYYHAITVASDERNVNQLRGLVDISLQTAESMIKLLKETDEMIKQLKGE